jgi:hypothetical protein
VVEAERSPEVPDVNDRAPELEEEVLEWPVVEGWLVEELVEEEVMEPAEEGRVLLWEGVVELWNSNFKFFKHPLPTLWTF